MKRCVLFLLTGPAHLPYLAVALDTLRRHWSGDTLVFAWDESFELAQKIAQDPRIQARCIKRNPAYRGKNQQELDKMRIVKNLNEYDEVMYVDADVIFAKDPTLFFDHISEYGFVATQFADWTMNVRTARNRVSNLLRFPEIPRVCVEKALEPHRPSYNSGVFGSRPGNAILDVWYDWTYASREIFISGETCLHPIASQFEISTLMRGIWNCSPKFKADDIPDTSVCLWHGHGDSFTRPNKSMKGYDIWWPNFLEVIEKNLGHIQTWIDSIDHKFLKELLKS